MQTLIAVSLLIIAVLAALGAGVFLGQLYAQFKQMRAENEQMKARLEDAKYPRRRTHADNARLEDLLAFAHDLREEIEITGLHLDQEHRDHNDRLRQLRALALSISENLSQARNSPPTAHPDDNLRKSTDLDRMPWIPKEF